MAWVTLAEADVKQRFSATEFDTVKSTTLATGLTNAITEALTEVAGEVRGYVRGCANNDLEASPKIPPECVGAARDLLGYKLAIRLPALNLLNDNRVKAYENAIAFLDKVAACEVAIEPPATPIDEDDSAGGTPSIAGAGGADIAERKFTQTTQDGL